METSWSRIYNGLNCWVADGRLAQSEPACTTVYYFNKVSKKEKEKKMVYKDDDEISLQIAFCHKDGGLPSC